MAVTAFGVIPITFTMVVYVPERRHRGFTVVSSVPGHPPADPARTGT
jgi:hypothetical protein